MGSLCTMVHMGQDGHVVVEGSGGISHGIPVYHGTYGMGWICRTLSLERDLVVYPMGSQCTMVHMGWDGYVGL